MKKTPKKAETDMAPEYDFSGGVRGHYAKRYPNVQVRLVEVIGPQIFAMLEKGEIHLAQAVARALTPDDRRFAVYPLAPMEMLSPLRKF